MDFECTPPKAVTLNCKPFNVLIYEMWGRHKEDCQFQIVIKEKVETEHEAGGTSVSLKGQRLA